VDVNVDARAIQQLILMLLLYIGDGPWRLPQCKDPTSPNCCPSFMHTPLCIYASTKASKHGHKLLVSKTKLCKKRCVEYLDVSERCATDFFLKNIRSGFERLHFFTQHPSLIAPPPAEFFRSKICHTFFTHLKQEFYKKYLWLYSANNTKTNNFFFKLWAPFFWLYTTPTLTRKFGL